MIRELVTTSRSYRRFYEERAIDEKTLRGLVDLGRLSPSGGNLQSLKYLLSATWEKNALIHPHLRWAGYLKGWHGPVAGERPAGYIVILHDRTISNNAGCDHGIAAQSILLGARELGLGGCMISSIDRDGLRTAMGIAEIYDILLVIALGHPKETVVLEDLPESGDVKYYRDNLNVHHVPKRRLEDIIIPWGK